MDFSFPKKERITSKTLLDKLFTEGKSVNNFPIKLVYLPTSFSDNTQLKILVVAPKRNFKSAVKRNQIKRLMREVYRLNKHTIFNNSETSFALAFLYLGKEMPDYQMIEEKMQGVIHKFLKKQADEKTV